MHLDTLEQNKEIETNSSAQVDFSQTAPHSGNLWMCVYHMHCGLITITFWHAAAYIL